jgi:hypothetical protein
MKTLSALAAVLMLLVAGCASKPTTAHTESVLAAVGFQVVPATTPEQLQQVQTLPPNTVTKVNRSGKTFYIFPDSSQKQLFIGTPQQYQDFLTRLDIERNAAADNAAAQESLREARTDSSGTWDNAWGNWTGTGGY